MRLVNRMILAFVFAALILGADAPIPIVEHAGTLADPDLVYNSETVAVMFDDNYTAAGVVIARIDAEVATNTGVLVSTFSWTTGWTIADGVVRVPIRVQAATLANGGYQIKVRVWDTFGNVSAYSDPYFVVKQWRTVERPGGCAIIP